MKILYLTQWYYPEPAKLNGDFAETLLEAGHEVLVVTGFPNYPAGKFYPGYKIRCRQRETINGVNIVRVPLYPSHDTSRIGRAMNFLSFAASSSLLGRFVSFQPDVIHVYHPPLTAMGAGWMLSRLYGPPFTCEIQDMWPETLAATSMVGNPRILKTVGCVARFLYRRAAAIRVISPGFRENLLAKGVPDEKIRVISNWTDTEAYRPSASDPAMADKLGLKGRFNIMYAGNIGLAQGCDTIIEAAEAVLDLPEVQFVFVGDGADLERIEKMASERNLKNVRFLGRFPQEVMAGLYALSDVLLLKLRDDPLFRITIPQKTLSYLACGKPILAAVGGDAAEVVLQAGAGLACSPGDAQGMAQTVRWFFAMPTEERQRMAENGRKAAVEQYGKKFLMGKMIDMLEEAVHQRQGR